MSLREMGDYKTTRLLDCYALNRIWSSTQRLEDLDWFGPKMPYVQYGVVFLLYCSRTRLLKVQRGAYKLVKQCRTRGSPTLSYVGGFPFYSRRWGPHLYLSSAVSWHRRGVLRPCQSSGPTRSVGSGVASSWLVFLGNGLSRHCPILG